MKSPHDPTKEIRLDIQALRGFAVSAVLFFHAGLGFSQGFLGVDIFFVISGFLITGMLQRSILQGTFTFSDFYYRRAKRLLPAAYVTFFVTSALAPFFLASQELRDFRSQLLGALTFVANVVLWGQSGYFEGAAELKPLLHVWSLSIEEQFYFVLPAALYLMPRKLWKTSVAAAVIASMVLCFFLVHRKPSVTFYMLPTRGWELGIGSMAALLPVSLVMGRVMSYFFWPAVAVLVSSPFLPISPLQPGPASLLVCLATAVVIIRRHPRAQSGYLTSPLAWIGDRSYSIYLVHWPVFAFFGNTWLAEDGVKPPIALRLTMVLGSVFLAVLLHRCVETPFRKATFTNKPRLLVATLAASFLIVCVGAWERTVVAGRDYVQSRRPNKGLNAKCDFSGAFAPIAECVTSPQPEFLVWGDSVAMHLVPGMAGASGPFANGLVQATRSMCGPLIGFAKIMPGRGGYDRAWADSCIEFNDSVLEYIRKNESIKFVVLSSLFTQYLDVPSGPLVVRGAEGRVSTVEPEMKWALEGASATVERVRSLGRKVVVIAPPPSGGGDLGRCAERRERKFPMTGIDQECRIPVLTFKTVQGKVLSFLKQLGVAAGVAVIDFEANLCSSSHCAGYLKGLPIYQDHVHLSYEGSEALAADSDLVNEIRRQAK